MDTGPLTIQELKQAISGLTNDKTPGEDKIRVEMPKAGSAIALNQLLNTVSQSNGRQCKAPSD